MEKQFDMRNTSAFKFIETFNLIVVSQARSSVYRTVFIEQIYVKFSYNTNSNLVLYIYYMYYFQILPL